MADAVAHRLALLQLSAELEQAALRAAATLEAGDPAAMLGASVALAHQIVSVALLVEALGRDAEQLTERAEAAELRMRRTLRGALRGLALDMAHAAGQAVRAKR